MGPDSARTYRLGLALTLASTVSWSTTGLFTRLIALDAWTMLAWRSLFGGFGLLVVIALLEGSDGLRRFGRLGWPGLAYVLASGFGMATYLSAMVSTTVAHVAVIYAVAPFVAAGLGWLVLRERPGGRALAASLIALVGVAVMVGLGPEGRPLGDFLALVMTVCMAAMMVLSRKFPAIPTLQAACVSALFASALAFLAMPSEPISTGQFGLLLVFGLVFNTVGLGLFILGARRLPPVETALISSLEAPIAPLWVWLLLAETPSAATLIGGTVVMAAVVGHILVGAQKA